MAMDQSGIFAKASNVHRQDSRGTLQLSGPCLDFRRFGGVLFSSKLYAPLDLPKSYRGKKTLAQFQTRKPCQDASVGLPLTCLGGNVRVNKIASQSNSGGLRDFNRPRLGKISSKRGASPRRISFQVGRFSSLSLLHSSTETTTAVSTPLRVTICGPFLRVSSMSSLKRALAS